MGQTLTKETKRPALRSMLAESLCKMNDIAKKPELSEEDQAKYDLFQDILSQLAPGGNRLGYLNGQDIVQIERIRHRICERHYESRTA